MAGKDFYVHELARANETIAGKNASIKALTEKNAAQEQVIESLRRENDRLVKLTKKTK
jgi:CHASE3 domain sensor protein